MLRLQNITKVLKSSSSYTYFLHQNELWKLWQCLQNYFFDSEVRAAVETDLWTASGSFDVRCSLFCSLLTTMTKVVVVFGFGRVSAFHFTVLCVNNINAHNESGEKCAADYSNEQPTNATLIQIENYENLCFALLVIFYMQSELVYGLILRFYEQNSL